MNHITIHVSPWAFQGILGGHLTSLICRVPDALGAGWTMDVHEPVTAACVRITVSSVLRNCHAMPGLMPGFTLVSFSAVEEIS